MLLSQPEILKKISRNPEVNEKINENNIEKLKKQVILFLFRN